MRMKKPPHPGRVVRQECIEPLGLTVTEAAKRLGVTRQALNNLVNGKGGVSAEMAVRLSKAFGSSPCPCRVTPVRHSRVASMYSIIGNTKLPMG